VPSSNLWQMKRTFETLKKPVVLATLIFILGTPLLVWVATTLVWSQALILLARQSEDHLAQYVRGLESSIELPERIAVLISHSATVVKLIGAPHDPLLQDTANHYLEQTNAEIHAAAVYIMDQQGTTIAASNWREDESFIRENYAFRPYFQAAIRGRRYNYIAMGVTSGELGLYVAAPIEVDGEIRGVAVVKSSLEHQRLLSTHLEQLFIVTDWNGVVFLSSRDNWLYRAVRPLPSYRRKEILETQQYSDTSFSPFPATVLSILNETSQLIRLQGFSEKPFFTGFNEATHLSQSAFLSSHGWEIRTFSNLQSAYLAAWIALASSLLLSIVVFLGTLFLIQRHLYIRRLIDTSILDPLTGLYTRRYLLDVVDIQFSQLDRRKTDCLVGVMLDIDHFKKINDSYGHQEGDCILKAVALAIKQSIRKGDIAVRYGGEEFTIILSSAESESAMACIERVRANTQALRFDPPLEAVQITLSAGVAYYQAGESLDDLLKRADLLLYRAKNLGRDRICCDRNDPSSNGIELTTAKNSA